MSVPTSVAVEAVTVREQDVTMTVDPQGITIGRVGPRGGLGRHMRLDGLDPEVLGRLCAAAQQIREQAIPRKAIEAAK